MKKSLFPGLLLLLLAAVMPTARAATTVPGPLVDSAWLAANQAKVVILDVRADARSFLGQPLWVKDTQSGKQSLVKVAGHIPGAALIDYKKVRAERVVDGKKVKGLIPDKADFEALIRAAGVNADSAIVITSEGRDSLDMTMATRLYWQLKYFGQDNMAILDGGLTQWLNDGHKTAAAASRHATGNWAAIAQRNELLATTGDVSAALKAGNVQFVDNRPLSQYLGVYKKSSVNAKGHLPGAKSFPNELMTGPTGKARFQSLAELKSLSAAMGVDDNKPTITYCNTGHLASGGWFIMHELMGNASVKLYDGSMHEYTQSHQDLQSMKLE